VTAENAQLLEKIRVMLISDHARFPKGNFLHAATRALEGGIRCLQLREKDLSPADLLALAQRLRALTLKHDALLFINDRADVAQMVEADGVHLPETGLPALEIKKKFPRLWVGVSTHSLQAAQRAEMEGADFITFSPIYETPSKKKFGPPQGLDRLHEVVKNIHLPVLALGGIKKDRVQPVLDRGAHGVALISGIWDSTDIRNEAFEYMKFFGGAEQHVH